MGSLVVSLLWVQDVAKGLEFCNGARGDLCELLQSQVPGLLGDFIGWAQDVEDFFGFV